MKSTEILPGVYDVAAQDGNGCYRAPLVDRDVPTLVTMGYFVLPTAFFSEDVAVVDEDLERPLILPDNAMHTPIALETRSGG